MEKHKNSLEHKNSLISSKASAVRRHLSIFKRHIIDWYESFTLKINLVKRRKLTTEFSQCHDVDDTIEFIGKQLNLSVGQKRSEIRSALEIADSINPRIACEIGTATGGNSILLTRYIPTIELMICVDLFVKNKALINLFRQPSQRIIFIDGSSYDANTVSRVRQILNGNKIDLLFIDGDHRYEGVKSDFLYYRQFVSNNGIILFHDIMPDQGDGWLYAGGVPTFWQEIKTFYPSQEFIDSPDQKAFGIGLIHYSDTVSLPFY